MDYGVNLRKSEQYLKRLISSAGEILVDFFRRDKLLKKQKGENDFVTEADLFVDQYIQKKLKEEFGSIKILSEETTSGDLKKYEKEGLLWVIDPLDGTTNFERHIPHFATSVALVSYNKPLLGVVYVPLLKNIYYARMDKIGAYKNGKRIFVSKVSNLKKAVVCTDWSHYPATFPKTSQFINKLLGKTRSLKLMGSLVSDMSLLAEGRIEAYRNLASLPWDTAAVFLIVQKAGGIVTNIAGEEFNIFTSGVLAANPFIHKELLNFNS